MSIDSSLEPSSAQADAKVASLPGFEVKKSGPIPIVPQHQGSDTPVSQQPRLPPELTDRILDHLDVESDGPTLRACALAGRVLHPRARTNLLRSLEIWSRQRCNAAAVWLAAPQYARCVRHLRLRMCDAIDPWDDESTAALLQCFHSRSIESNDCSKNELGDTCEAGVKVLDLLWLNITKMPLTSAMLAIPSVTTLYLSNLWFARQEDFCVFMDGFPALERLTIGGHIHLGEASLPWNPSEAALQSAPKPRLHTLDLSEMSETPAQEGLVLQWFLNQPPEQNIRIKRLGYIGCRRDLEISLAVLEALSASVEHLCIGGAMMRALGNESTDTLLEHLTSLRTVELRFVNRSRDEGLAFPIEDLMAQIKSKPRSIHVYNKGALRPQTFDTLDLSHLDNALSCQPQFDQLEDVNVTIRPMKNPTLAHERAYGSRLVGQVLSAMPGMRERGVLRVTMDYYD